MLLPSTCYHIYNHGNADDLLFREQKNYPFFLGKYRLHLDPIVETIGWCLMPNHFHLLVKIKSEEELLNHLNSKNLANLDLSKQVSRGFSNFFNSYSKAFNKTYQRKGSLFIKNFKRKEVTSEDYLRTLIHYIHTNPVKHGFVRNSTQWEWSSFHQFEAISNNWIQSLFDNVHNYREAHNAYEKNLFKSNFTLDPE